MRGLLADCLPEHLRALDAAGARRVVDLLEERVAAGWSPAQIRSVMDQPLPPRVGRLASLVARRLELNVDPGLAPAADAVVERVADDERIERSRLRSEALAARPRRRGPDPVLERALAQARREMPDAGGVEVARAAASLVVRWRVGGGPDRQ